MPDLCAEHCIGPNNQVIFIRTISDVYREVEKGENCFRHVIDMASLKQEMAEKASEAVGA